MGLRRVSRNSLLRRLRPKEKTFGVRDLRTKYRTARKYCDKKTKSIAESTLIFSATPYSPPNTRFSAHFRNHFAPRHLREERLFPCATVQMPRHQTCLFASRYLSFRGSEGKLSRCEKPCIEARKMAYRKANFAGGALGRCERPRLTTFREPPTAFRASRQTLFAILFVNLWIIILFHKFT